MQHKILYIHIEKNSNIDYAYRENLYIGYCL